MPFSIEVLSPPPATADAGSAPLVTIVRLSGTLDGAASARARGELAIAAARAKGTFVFDLADLHLVDSQGIGALLETQLHLKARGDRVYLTNVRPPVRRALDLIHALPNDIVFPTREALDAHLRALQRDASREPNDR